MFTLEQLHQFGYNCAKWKKAADFTQFEEKKTHSSLCKIVHLCTITTVTVHICMVTVALPFNILMFLFIILMLYSYGIKTSISHFFSLLSLGNTNASACLSCFIPELFLSSSLSSSHFFSAESFLAPSYSQHYIFIIALRIFIITFCFSFD